MRGHHPLELWVAITCMFTIPLGPILAWSGLVKSEMSVGVALLVCGVGSAVAVAAQERVKGPDYNPLVWWFNTCLYATAGLLLYSFVRWLI